MFLDEGCWPIMGSWTAGSERLARAMPVTPVRRTIFPYAFACPAGVLRDNGHGMGCTEVMSPWGDAVAGEPTRPPATP
jgi:hypothetical protein